MLEDPGSEEIIDGYHLLPTLPVSPELFLLYPLKTSKTVRCPPMSPAPYDTPLTIGPRRCTPSTDPWTYCGALTEGPGQLRH